MAPLDQHGNRRSAGNTLLEKLKTLGAQLRRDLRQAGDIPSRPREIGNETCADRIEDRQHDNGDIASCLLCGLSRLGPVCRDNADPQPSEFAGQCWQQLVLSFGRAILNGKVLALDVPVISETLPKCLDAGLLCAEKVSE